MLFSKKNILIVAIVIVIVYLIYKNSKTKKDGDDKGRGGFLKNIVPIAKPKGAISSNKSANDGATIDSVKSNDSTRLSNAKNADNSVDKEQVLYSLPEDRLNFFYAQKTNELFPMILVNKSKTVVELPLYKSIAGIGKPEYKFRNAYPGEKIYISDIKRLNYYGEHEVMSDDMFITYDGHVLSYQIAQRDFGIKRPSKKEKQEMKMALLVDKRIEKAKSEGILFGL